MPVLHPLPEVVGEVPEDMFDNVLAARGFGYITDTYHPDEIRFDRKLSDYDYKLHEALSPLINLVLERESTRIVRLNTSVNFGELAKVGDLDVHHWHKDGLRLQRTARYVVARGLGTEFRVPGWCARSITNDGVSSHLGLDVVRNEGRHSIVQPRPLTVVRFKRHKHRAPVDPARSIGRRPWIRMSSYSWSDD